ncbi:S-methyl-5-thioribose-1-phosphate isomerase [Dissophora globulifera]|nr:S-methyl-5-thioribose-1-phosphate isomerase [Dissophora globulifera]
MTYSRRCALGAVYLLYVLPSIFSVTTVQAQTTNQSLCTAQVCISATIFSKDPNTIEFSLASKDQVGWLGLGTGGSASGMAGNDLAICWPDSTGKGAVISQRAAVTNGPPLVRSTTPPYQIQAQKSGLQATSTAFTCTFSRALDLTTAPIATTATSINVIFAVGLQTVRPAANGDPQKAEIQQHAYTGKGVLTIVRKNGASLDGFNATAPSTTGNGGGNSGVVGTGSGELKDELALAIKMDRLVRAHGIMMTVAFLFIFPIGAFLVRFFSHLHHVFRWHRPLQVTGFLTVFAALGCVLASVYSDPDGAPMVNETSHSLFGVILITALVLQVCIGIFIFHTFNPNRDPNKIHVPTWMHRIWGYAVLIGGLVQVNLGIARYGMWPTGKEGVWLAYDVWVALLVLVFLGGSVLKKWMEVRRTRKGQ